jgi:hypothetical protein
MQATVCDGRTAPLSCVTTKLYVLGTAQRRLSRGTNAPNISQAVQSALQTAPCVARDARHVSCRISVTATVFLKPLQLALVF